MAKQLIKNITRLSDLPELSKAEGKTIAAFNRENYQVDLNLIRGKKILSAKEIKSDNSDFPNLIVLKFTDGTTYTLYVYNGSDGDIGKTGDQGPKGKSGESAVVDFEKAFAEGQLIIVNDIVKLDSPVDDEHDSTCLQAWSAYRGKAANEAANLLNETFLTDAEYNTLFNKENIQYLEAEFTSKDDNQDVLIFNYDTNPHIKYYKYWTYEDSNLDTYYVYNSITGKFDPVVADLWEDVYLGEKSGFFPITTSQFSDGTELYFYDAVTDSYIKLEKEYEEGIDDYGNQIVVKNEFNIKYFDVDLDEYINVRYDYVTDNYEYSLDAASELVPEFYERVITEITDWEEHEATAEDVENGIANEVGEIVPKKTHDVISYSRVNPEDVDSSAFAVYYEYVLDDTGKYVYREIENITSFLAIKETRWFALNENGRYDEVESEADIDKDNFQDYIKVTIDKVKGVYTFHRWYPFTKYDITSYKEVEKTYTQSGIQLYSEWEDRTYYTSALVTNDGGVTYETEYYPIPIPDWIYAEFTTVEEDETALLLNSVHEYGVEDNSEIDTSLEDYEDEELETIPVQFMVAGTLQDIYKKEDDIYVKVDLSTELAEDKIFFGSNGLVMNDSYYMKLDPLFIPVVGSEIDEYVLVYDASGNLFTGTIDPQQTYYMKEDQYEEIDSTFFSEYTIILFAGVPQQLPISFYPLDANNKKAVIKYDSDVITFYEDGRIASLEENGMTDIYIVPETGQGLHITVILTTPVKSISLNEDGFGLSKNTIVVGDTATLKALIRPATSSNKAIDYSLSEEVVEIGEQELEDNAVTVELTGTAQGTSTIYLKANDTYGASASTRIEVVKPVEEMGWELLDTPGPNDIAFVKEEKWTQRDADNYNALNRLQPEDEGYVTTDTVKTPAYYKMSILKNKEYRLSIAIDEESKDSSRTDITWTTNPNGIAVVSKKTETVVDVPARPATQEDVDNNLASEVGAMIPEKTHEETFYSIKGIAAGECILHGVNTFNTQYFDEGDAHITDTEIELKVTVIEAVESIVVDPPTLMFNINSSKIVSATVLPEEANEKSYHWRSEDTSIATVDANGKVTSGTVPGRTQIVAESEDGSGTYGICNVTITVPMTNLSFENGLVYVGVGQTIQITAKTLDIDIENPSLNWKTANAAIATVTGSGMVGSITGKEIGTTTIVASDATNSGVTGTIQVSVILLATSIVFAETEIMMNTNDMLVLTPAFTPSEASIQALKYSSSDESIAKVTDDGIVTAISEGTVEITAYTTDGSNLSASCTIEIVE